MINLSYSSRSAYVTFLLEMYFHRRIWSWIWYHLYIDFLHVSKTYVLNNRLRPYHGTVAHVRHIYSSIEIADLIISACIVIDCIDGNSWSIVFGN